MSSGRDASAAAAGAVAAAAGSRVMPASRSSSPTVRFRRPRVEVTQARPKAVLTTLTLLGVIYTASISGGYGLEDSVRAGGPLLSIAFLCIIPFVWGVPVSLCVAELSCAIPSNAGPIMWVNCAFPSWMTFTTVLWTALLNTVDNSLYPAVFADYCATFFHLGGVGKVAVKVVFLWLCALINVVGMHLVGHFSVAIMVLTILPFFLMFVLQVPHGFDWERITYVPKHINWSLFLPVVAWNFSGFDSAGNVIEEVQNVHPTFVRALILMIVAALATYIPPILAGASAAALRKVPFSAWNDGYWVMVGHAVGGVPMAAIVMVGGGISTLGLMITLLATTSRSLAGMGTLNAFPGFVSRWLARYSARHQTPVNAILVNTTLTCILASTLTFQTLVQIDQVLYSLRLIAILASFVRLRWRQPLLQRPFVVPGGLSAAMVWAAVPSAFCVVLIIMTATDGVFVLATSMVIIVGTMTLSYAVVHLVRPDGFEGDLVEEYADADMGTYGTFLNMESPEWRKYHPTHAFVENAPRIDHSRFDNTH